MIAKPTVLILGAGASVDYGKTRSQLQPHSLQNSSIMPP